MKERRTRVISVKRRTKNTRIRPRAEKPLSRTAEKRIRKLIENPPRGSAIAKAKKFGVDLYALIEKLKLTPTERFERADAERMFAETWREAGRKAGL